MRDDSIATHASLFLTPDPQTSVGHTNLNLIRIYSRKFHAYEDGVIGLTKINGRSPGARSQRIICLSSFLKGGKQTTDAVTKALQFESFQPGCPYRLHNQDPKLLSPTK